MKKYIYMAVAAIAALSSCSSDNDPIMGETGKQALVFTATMEGSEGTRAIYDIDNKCASWEATDATVDQISINGVKYNAQSTGLTTTFRAAAVGEEAGGGPYEAYFPADLYDGGTATLPAIQTYKAGKFNMPMYAYSTTTDLAFKNLCAVLAIKVTRDDIEKLKSIKVASDQKMNGSFTVNPTTNDYKAVIGDGTNAVVLECSEALALTPEGTTFYIAIPAQDYQYLNIFLSADGVTYTQAMATKKAVGLGEIARSTIYYIDYAKNATKMWEGNLFVADYNVGVTDHKAESYGGYYCWGGTYNNDPDLPGFSWNNYYNTGSSELSHTGDDITDTATNLWGSNWRMPTDEEFEALLGNCNVSFTTVNGVNGLLCTRMTAPYSSNSVFLPAAGISYEGILESQGEEGEYLSSTPYDIDGAYDLYFSLYGPGVDQVDRYGGFSVRAVLVEAEGPVSAPATTGTAKRKDGTDVNWVQLWKNGPKFAEYNVGANIVTDVGTTMTYIEATATNFTWGANWCTPRFYQMNELLLAARGDSDSKVTCDYIQEGGTWGFKFTGKETYTDNSVFFPAQEGDSDGGRASYWLTTADEGDRASGVDLYYYLGYWMSTELWSVKDNSYLVRPVLKN